MKIAHIAPPWIATPPKNYGGTEFVIYNLVEALVDQGHDVTLFSPGDARTSAKHISFFPKSLVGEGVPWPAHLKAYYHMHKSLEYAEEFDIIHTHLSSGADMYIFPLTAGLATPHVTTHHSPFPFDRVQLWTGDADEFYLKEWASSVPMVALSQSALKEAPCELDFVGVVHNGLDMREYRHTGEKRGDYFVWLGRFVPYKGAHLAIEAARRANVPLILAGTYDRHEPASVRYFEEVIKPQIDGEQVKYIGPVNMAQKIQLLSSARGSLNPIEWEEPFGLVMTEAMALGCTVISFNRGAAPEIITHGETGFLVDDVEEMVCYIPRIEEIDRNVIRKHVEENFSAHAMAKKYLEIYEKVILMNGGSSMDKVLSLAV